MADMKTIDGNKYIKQPICDGYDNRWVCRRSDGTATLVELDENDQEITIESLPRWDGQDADQAIAHTLKTFGPAFAELARRDSKG